MINNSDTKVSYRGNGQTTVFPFSFPFIKKEYIHVAIYDETTSEVTILTSDYYVDAAANTVIYPGYPPGEEPAEANRPPILPATAVLTIFRQTDIDQLIDLGKKYPLPEIESMADKLTEILQEQAETLSRTLKVEMGSAKSIDDYLQEIKNNATTAKQSAEAAGQSEANSAQSAAEAANSAVNAQSAAETAEGWAAMASSRAAAAEQSALSAKAYSAPDWNAGTAYTAGEVVSYIDGNSYRCIADCTGIVPTNTAYWTKITAYVGDDFWLLDAAGYIVPNTNPTYSGRWAIDGSGYIVPINNVA